jgi:hypothetical protein
MSPHLISGDSWMPWGEWDFNGIFMGLKWDSNGILMGFKFKWDI